MDLWGWPFHWCSSLAIYPGVACPNSLSPFIAACHSMDGLMFLTIYLSKYI